MKVKLLNDKAEELEVCSSARKESWVAYHCDNKCQKIVHLQQYVCEEIQKISKRMKANRRSVHERVGDQDQVAWTNNLSSIKPKESSEEEFARESGIWKPGKSSK